MSDLFTEFDDFFQSEDVTTEIAKREAYHAQKFTLEEWVRTLVYNPYYTPNEKSLPGFREASKKVKYLVYEITNQKRVIASRSVAIAMVKQHCGRDDYFSEADIDEAYAIGPGGGCEFEWEFE